jgi:hypothetical protein
MWRGVIRFSHGSRTRVYARAWSPDLAVVAVESLFIRTEYRGYQHREREKRTREMDCECEHANSHGHSLLCNPTNNAVAVVGCGSFFVALESTLEFRHTFSQPPIGNTTSGNTKCQTHLVSKIKSKNCCFQKQDTFLSC